MENIRLRKATSKDRAIVADFDYSLDKDEHIKLHRIEKITKAISNEECFLILIDKQEVGFVIFDYRFFDQGRIELIIIDEKYRRKGVGGKTFDIIREQSKSDKVFTSTNNSTTQMQRALTKANFTFAGKLYGLDEGDPEVFYYKNI